MSWVERIFLGAIIPLAVTLFHQKKKAKPKASHGSKYVGRASAESERRLLEAYMGIRRSVFSTGPEAFNHYLEVFQNATSHGRSADASLPDTVTALAFAIDAKDHYTYRHSQAVSHLAAQIARQLGLSDTQVEEIRLGGILHDIGKTGVPNAILNKPSGLTSGEYHLMTRHTLVGERLLEPLKVKAIERIRGMVRHHHERIDGTGYPHGLKGENIPLGARIVAVAGSFDNMVSDLLYRHGRSTEEAVAELRRCSGTQFDPDIVEAFVRSLELPGDSRPPANLD